MATNNQTDSEIIISPFAGGGSQVTGPTTFTVTNNGPVSVNVVGIAFNKPAGVGHIANMGNFGGSSSNSNSSFSTNTIIDPSTSKTFIVTYSKSSGAAIGIQSGNIVITTAQGASATVSVSFDIREDTPTDSGGTDTGTDTGTTGDGDFTPDDTDVGTDTGTGIGADVVDGAPDATDGTAADAVDGAPDATDTDAGAAPDATDTDASSGTDGVSGTDSA